MGSRVDEGALVIGAGMMGRARRVLRRRLHRLVNSRELARLRQLGLEPANELADVLEAWQAREPIHDPVIGEIERQRRDWLATPDDSSDNERFRDKHTIARACRASKPPVWAELLYRLVNRLQPRVVLELGTNLGISSAYLGAAGRQGDVSIVTLDGAPARLQLARGLHARLGLRNVSYHLGTFSRTLPGVLEAIPAISLAFIDGHHHRQPTLDYFDQVFPRLHDQSVVVFDDICWSRGMVEAWRALCADRRFSFIVDLTNVGIAVVRKSDADGPPPIFRIAAATNR